jgi:hypothetical protein
MTQIEQIYADFILKKEFYLPISKKSSASLGFAVTCACEEKI